MKTAFITGATSGIGEGFAEEYAKRGYALILTGRREDKLLVMKTAYQKKYGIPVRGIAADLGKEEEVRRLCGLLNDVPIDVFINNAGFGTCGFFLQTDLEKELDMIRVNDLAMHFLFKRILQKMQKQGRGSILNVASSAGLLPGGPYMAAYYAGKSYAVSLTRGVSRELREQKSPVYVCALCPGPVDTAFNERADVSFALKGISVETCIRAAFLGMKRRQTIIVPGRMMALGMRLQRLLPAEVLLSVTGRQQKKKFLKEISKRKQPRIDGEEQIVKNR